MSDLWNETPNNSENENNTSQNEIVETAKQEEVAPQQPTIPPQVEPTMQSNENANTPNIVPDLNKNTETNQQTSSVPTPQQPQQPQVPVQPPYQPPVQPNYQRPVQPQMPPQGWQQNNGPQPQWNGNGWSRPPVQPQYPYNGSQTPTPSPKKPKRNPIVTTVIICLLVIVFGCVAIGIALLGSDDNNIASDSQSTAESTVESANEGPTVSINENDENDGGLTTKEIVSKNLDSTVVINMYGNATITYGGFSFGNSKEESKLGTASGIVMSKDGYIITNAHVVLNENTNEVHTRIEVVLYSGATYTAKVIGYDEDTDLAIIKVEANNLKPASFGNSDAVSIGDRVVTIGNSGGLEWSASQGIISGLKRDVYDETGYSIQCLQIDAVINPGNSGGPLLNNKGEVIGINSAKIVYSGIEGLGFSIPIKEAKSILDDFIKFGHVTGRVELGISGYTVTQAGYEGFLVYEINADSCLQGTSIQQYDIITGINGTDISNRTELRNQLSKYKPGDTVTLSMLRITNRSTGETETFNVQVTLKESSAN